MLIIIIVIVIVIMHLKTKVHAWHYYLLPYYSKKITSMDKTCLTSHLGAYLMSSVL